MNEQITDRLAVPLLAQGITRPIWSVMIPTYNCAEYLRTTLASVLMQDPGHELMHIEVVDDHSTQDNPAAVVAELGQGRVEFYQQPQNVGHIQNFQTCLTRSRGHLVHLLHGDDAIRSHFYGKMQQAFEQHPDLGAAFCRQIMMDEQGHWLYLSGLEQSQSGILDHWLERIAVEQRIQTPSIVVRREVYEQLGGFDRRLSWTEDWEMWVRIAAHYPVWYEVEPLALYRIHSHSSTDRRTRTGENLQDVRRAIEIFQRYLPETEAQRLSNQARENWAVDAIVYDIPRLLAEGDLGAVFSQIREALKCRRSARVFWQLLRLQPRLGRSGLRAIGRLRRGGVIAAIERLPLRKSSQKHPV